ncbi:hypothetical protein ACWEKM_19505 [Streptomyces sp. NPDC004752]
MPSVLGLVEAREEKVRAEVARLREEAERVTAVLSAAEVQLERFGQARVTVTEVPAGPDADTTTQARAAAVPGATVPHRAEGISAEALAPEYQRILAVLAALEAEGGVRAKPVALALGERVVPARVEGVRSRLKRLVVRGWAAEVEPGLFTVGWERVPVAA